MLRSGQYWIGDLCYVMNKEWDQVCQLLFHGRTDHGCNEGEFNLPDGRRFAIYNTQWGDGVYSDGEGGEYPVDSGSIGCIRVADIDTANPNNNLALGRIVEFAQDFNTGRTEGIIQIGKISVDTDPSECEYDEEETL